MSVSQIQHEGHVCTLSCSTNNIYSSARHVRPFMISSRPALSPINLSSLISNIYIPGYAYIPPNIAHSPFGPSVFSSNSICQAFPSPICPKHVYQCLDSAQLLPSQESPSWYLQVEGNTSSSTCSHADLLCHYNITRFLALICFYHLHRPFECEDLEGWVHSTASCMLGNFIWVHSMCLCLPGCIQQEIVSRSSKSNLIQ